MLPYTHSQIELTFKQQTFKQEQTVYLILAAFKGWIREA